MGLVSQIISFEQVSFNACRIAEMIAKGPSLSARWKKKFKYRQLNPTSLSKAEIEKGFDSYDTKDFPTNGEEFFSRTSPIFAS